jgi:hypothetical protein
MPHVDPTKDPAIGGVLQTQMPFGKCHVSASRWTGEMRGAQVGLGKIHIHNLPVKSKVERPILDSIEIKAIQPVCEGERSYESTFIRKQGTLYEVSRLAML